ncbi:MFS general substrate transporter [Calocera cornea HHB12733]|uniref:MFS general substrate transporter n=1 Tax=Calocera cornea HHB12733 TaxID=1353952 RepID=A0A165HVS8_9BASI|nr:MFS general substrate transporter [Calocera cornea HHB12733]
MGIHRFVKSKLRETVDEAGPAFSKEHDEKTLSSQHVPSLRSWNSICIVGLTSTAMLLNICGVSSMSIALPSVGRDLGIPTSTLQWLMTAYSLTSGCFLLLFGRLADIFGRKHVFLLGDIWLIAFSIGCGFANQGITIIIMRALAGMGTAATIPACLGILAKTFPPSRARSIAFATFSAGAPIGAAFGQVLGGVLTQYAPISWRAIFFVMAGIAAVTFIGAFLTFPPDAPLSEDRRVDWVGAFLITVGLVLFTFVLGQGQIAPQGWKTPYIISLLVIGLLMIGGFIAWEHHVEFRTDKPPLMRLSLWARAGGRFAAVQVIGFLAWAAFSTFSFWATLYYQNYLGLPPIQTMLRFLPMSVTGFLVNVVFALVSGVIPAQFLIMIGCIGTGLANLLFAVIQTTAPYWAFGFPAAIVSVFGADFIFASSTLYGSHIAQHHEQSLAGGIFNTVTQIGTAFGMTITTIVYDTVIRSQSVKEGVVLNEDGSNASLAAQLYGQRCAQWTSFAFAMAALAVAIVALRGMGIIGGSAKKAPSPEDPSPKDLEASGEPSEKLDQAGANRNSAERPVAPQPAPDEPVPKYGSPLESVMSEDTIVDEDTGSKPPTGQPR